MRITAISAKTMTPAVLRRRLSVSRALPAGTPCGFPLSSQDEDNFPRFEFDISAGDFLQDLRLGGGDVNGPLPPALSPIDTSLSYSADTLDALQASAAAVAPHSLSHAPPVDMREGGDQGLQREGGAQEASEVENPARGGEEFSEGMSQEVQLPSQVSEVATGFEGGPVSLDDTEFMTQERFNLREGGMSSEPENSENVQDVSTGQEPSENPGYDSFNELSEGE